VVVNETGDVQSFQSGFINGYGSANNLINLLTMDIRRSINTLSIANAGESELPERKSGVLFTIVNQLNTGLKL
jgi:hypothetical protein